MKHNNRCHDKLRVKILGIFNRDYRLCKLYYVLYGKTGRRYTIYLDNCQSYLIFWFIKKSIFMLDLGDYQARLKSPGCNINKEFSSPPIISEEYTRWRNLTLIIVPRVPNPRAGLS